MKKIILLCSCCLLFVLLSFGQAVRWDAGILEDVDFERQKLGSSINTASVNTCPYVSLDNQMLIFSKAGHPLNFGQKDLEDIWFSFKNNAESWSNAVNASSSINCAQADFIAGMHPSQNIIYVANQNQNTPLFNLIVYRKSGRFWSPPQEMVLEIPENFISISSVFVNASGTILLVCAEIQDGKNKQYDIFMARRKSANSWSKFSSFGSPVNTKGQEKSAYLAADEVTLYFSTDSNNGFGGQDLFMSKRLDDTWQNWTAPVNLGNQINSSNDETHISIIGKGDIAYFSASDKSGQTAIYQVNLPQTLRPVPVRIVKGQVIGLSDILEEQSSISPFNPLFEELKDDQQQHYAGLEVEGGFLNLLDGIGGYYPQIEQIPTEQQELDFDQYNLLSSIKEDQTSYFQREAEIELAQIKINHFRVDLKEYLFAIHHLQHLLNKKEREIIHQSTAKWLPIALKQYLDTIPPAKSTPNKKVLVSKEQKEMQELRKKFDQYYGDTEVDPFGDDYLWEKPMGFEDFLVEVEEELAMELSPEVEYELKLKMYGEVKNELMEELGGEALFYLENNEANLREQIRQSFNSKGLEEVGNIAVNKEAAVSGEDEILKGEALKNLMKEALREQVKRDLEQQLSGHVRDVLKGELSYLSQKSVEEKWQEQLDRKVELQIEEEQKSGMEINGLIPLSFEYNNNDEVIPYIETETQDLSLIPIKTGQIVKLSSIAFSPNAAVLKSKSFSELDRLVSFLKKNSNLNIEIGAHTNGWVSYSFGEELSEKRAKVVVEYLKAKGISENRLTAMGYGKKRPVASNETLEGRRMNQRVEFKILNH